MTNQNQLHYHETTRGHAVDQFMLERETGKKVLRKRLLNLCPRHAHYYQPYEIGEITGRQSCDICKERNG